jgi:hypothetical protein
MSLYNTLVTSELTLEPGKSINASGLWYSDRDSYYINRPALGLKSYK